MALVPDGSAPENLVLLHGFAGTRRTWDGVLERLAPERYTPLAIDLPGHGDATVAAGAYDGVGANTGAGADTGAHGGEATITFPACVERVLAKSPPRFTLCGYSLGGRVGLNVALSAPERVRRLVLVSSTAGMADGEERAARRVADDALADDLEGRSFEEFMDRWESQPLFVEDPPEVHAAMRAEQQRNDSRALAAVLRGIGTGVMPPLWDRLAGLNMPVTVVVGRRDAKCHVSGQEMVKLLPDAELRIVPGGHRLPHESPQAVADAIAQLPVDPSR